MGGPAWEWEWRATKEQAGGCWWQPPHAESSAPPGERSHLTKLPSSEIQLPYPLGPRGGGWGIDGGDAHWLNEGLSAIKQAH